MHADEEPRASPEGSLHFVRVPLEAEGPVGRQNLRALTREMDINMSLAPQIAQTNSSDPWVRAVFWTTLLLGFYREVAGSFTIMVIGSYNFTIVEPVVILCGLAILRVMSRAPGLSLRNVLMMSFGGLILIGFSRGLLVRPYDAITSLRLTGPLALILVWGAFIPAVETWHPRVQRALVTVGVMLGVVVMLRAVMGPSFLVIADVSNDLDINDGGRSLSAQGAIMLGSAAIVSLSRFFQRGFDGRARMVGVLVAAFLLVALLMTKQATATLAVIAALAGFFALAPGPLRNIRVLVLTIAFGAAGFLYYVLPDLISDFNSLLPPSMAFDLSHRSQTFEARMEIWDGLLVDFHTWNWLSQLIGLPAGVKPVVWIQRWGGMYWDLSIHSMYYGVLPYAGVLGLCLYVLTLATAALGCVVRSFREGYSAFPDAPLGFALIIIIAILGVSYEIRNENALLVVLSVAGATPAAFRNRRRIANVTPRGAHLAMQGRDSRAVGLPIK